MSSDTSIMRLSDTYPTLVFLPLRVEVALYLQDNLKAQVTSSGSKREAACQSYAFQLNQPASFDRAELSTLEGEALAVFRWPSTVPNASFLNLDLPLNDLPNRRLATPAALHVKDEVRLQLQEALREHLQDVERSRAELQAVTKRVQDSLPGFDDLLKQVAGLEKQLEQLRQELRQIKQSGGSKPPNNPSSKPSGN